MLYLRRAVLVPLWGIHTILDFRFWIENCLLNQAGVNPSATLTFQLGIKIQNEHSISISLILNGRFI